MAKNLVIVESPAKAKTIEGYLGKDFVVKSSMGHIRDLAKGNDSVDIDNDFTPSTKSALPQEGGDRTQIPRQESRHRVARDG